MYQTNSNYDSSGAVSQIMNNVTSRIRGLVDSINPEIKILTSDEIELQFRSSTLLQKIIKKYPEEAKAIGYELIDGKGEVIEKNEPILIEAIKEGLIYSRLYGRCFLFLDVNDLLSLKMPVRRGSVLKSFEVLFDLQEDSEGYYIIEDKLVHPSRILEIKGVKSYSKKNTETVDSVIQGLFVSLQNYCKNIDDAKYILENLSYLSVGITNFASMNKSDIGREKVQEQLHYVNYNRSIHHLITHDKDLESVSFISQNLGGVRDVIEEVKQVFVAETDYPVEELFEKSTSATLGTGVQNQLVARYLWLQRCQNWAKNNVLPYYLEFFKRTKDMTGITVKIPFELSLNPLEEGELNTLLADMTTKLYTAGIIDLEEARSVYRKDKISFNIALK